MLSLKLCRGRDRLSLLLPLKIKVYEWRLDRVDDERMFVQE